MCKGVIAVNTASAAMEGRRSGEGSKPREGEVGAGEEEEKVAGEREAGKALVV